MKNLTPLLLVLPLLLLPPAALFACANTGTAGSQTDDALIKMRVGSRLTADPEVSRFKIDVDVREAVVTLRGEVESQAMADDRARRRGRPGTRS